MWRLDRGVQRRVPRLGPRLEALAAHLAGGHRLGVAAEDDVDASARHVRRDGDRAGSPRLGDDLGLSEVLLRVQHLVGHAALVEEPREVLGLGDRGGADEDRLAAVPPLDDVIDDGLELRVLGLVDEVGLVATLARHVGRDRDDGEVVGVAELRRLGLGGARHAGELLVEAEVVLQRDRRPGVVLVLDLHALLGLDGLVRAVGPPATLERAAGELVDDLHLAAVDEVVLVAVVQLLGHAAPG